METSAIQETGFKRAPAVKVRVADIVNGRWQEGAAGANGAPNKFLETSQGDKVTRVRVLGTVVTKFVSEDGSFASLTLDDFTETIRVKAWDTIKMITGFGVGDVVDLVGKAKFYQDEIYIVPEIAIKVTDPNLELLRRLELVRKYGAGGSANKVGDGGLQEAEKLRKEILKVIGSVENGVEYPVIFERVKASHGKIESVIDDLLSGGLCYEPTPGVIRKI